MLFSGFYQGCITDLNYTTNLILDLLLLRHNFITQAINMHLPYARWLSISASLLSILIGNASQLTSDKSNGHLIIIELAR